MSVIFGFIIYYSFLSALTAGLARAEFTVNVAGPDDVNFKDAFGNIEFPDIDEILSVQSPLPHLLLGDEVSKNKVAFRGSLPDCAIKFSVIGKKKDGTIVKYDGTIKKATFKPSDVNHAVVIKGGQTPLHSLVDGLAGQYDVSVVGNNVVGDSKMAIVLRDKDGNIVPQADAEEIVKKKLDELKNGLVTERPGCFETCRTVCESVLVIDSSKGFVEEGAVKNLNDRVFMGMPTKWESKCGKDAFVGTSMLCSSATCGAGTCRKTFNESRYGVCTCPIVKNEQRGPNCQIMTRSYKGGSGAQSITTHHRVRDDVSQPETLSLSFKFAGKCQNADDVLCTILKVESASKDLAQVQLGRISEPMYTTATLPSMPKDSTKTILRSDGLLQQGLWMHVSMVTKLAGTTLKTVTVFCTIEVNPECIEQSAESMASKQLTLKDAIVRIGGAFDGCFRNVRLNGRIVDLKIDGQTGPADKTSEVCSQQDATCASGSRYLCGDKSVCYGFLGADRKDACKCQCIGNTRLTTEKITNPAQCADYCSVDLPVITTEASSHSISWAMHNGDQIPVAAAARLQVLFRFRTRVRDAPQMLQIDTTGPGAVVVIVRIKDDALQCCLGSTCYSFTPRVVSDGFWHEAYVGSARSQLLLRVDDYTQVHLVATEILIKSFKASMNLQSSCITGLRVVDVYMPTGSTDATLDTDKVSVKMTSVASGVKVGAKCQDSSPACTCNKDTETCEGVWGAKSCVCRTGYQKSGSSCVAPSDNPCTRLKIRCPNAGGTCAKVNGKWQVCQ